MNDLEAARLAKMMRDKPSNINVPSDPTFALAMMEHALRATEKPAESDLGVSGYHPVSVKPHDLQRKRDDYVDEQQQIEDVVWFFQAGNSILETARFFKLGYRYTVGLLKKGRVL
jgi:hypothetical protein